MISPACPRMRWWCATLFPQLNQADCYSDCFSYRIITSIRDKLKWLSDYKVLPICASHVSISIIVVVFYRQLTSASFVVTWPHVMLVSQFLLGCHQSRTLPPSPLSKASLLGTIFREILYLCLLCPRSYKYILYWVLLFQVFCVSVTPSLTPWVLFKSSCYRSLSGSSLVVLEFLNQYPETMYCL